MVNKTLGIEADNCAGLVAVVICAVIENFLGG